jgi:predicted transcriptional regulator
MAKRCEVKQHILVGAKVTPEIAQKLADLARATHRDQASVIRLLLAHATVAPVPDIQSHVVEVGVEVGKA